MEIGMVKFSRIPNSLRINTNNNVMEDIKTVPAKTLNASLVPVWRMTPLQEPTIKKEIKPIRKMTGNCDPKATLSKLKVASNLAKQAKTKEILIKNKSMVNTNHLDEYL